MIIDALLNFSLSTLKIHFIQLDEAGHNDYTKPDTADGQRYQTMVHAIYKKHGLPYIETFAKQVSEDELPSADLTSARYSTQLYHQINFWEQSKPGVAEKTKRDERQKITRHALSGLMNNDQHYTRREIEVLQQLPLYTKYPDTVFFSPGAHTVVGSRPNNIRIKH
ncbi:MAG: hypothetical protein NTW08_04875 [Gammaproteobacteria bacterium]|nr:hypothetical protein [Gammaproteobacteria bacterium]